MKKAKLKLLSSSDVPFTKPTREIVFSSHVFDDESYVISNRTKEQVIEMVNKIFDAIAAKNKTIDE